MACVFSCDAGTTSVKSALCTADGTFLHTMHTQIIADAPKLQQYVEAIRTQLNTARSIAETRRLSVKAISVSGNGPSLVAVQNGGCNNKTDRLFLWNDPVDAAITDNDIHFLDRFCTKSFFLPRLFYFFKQQPAAIKKASCIMPLPEYLSYTLTGHKAIFLPTADYEPAYWSDKELQAFKKYTGVMPALPSFIPTGTACGSVDGIPVIAGGPDFFSALIGTGTIYDGTSCDRSGSSEGINVCIEKAPEHLPGIRILPSVLPGRCNVSILLGETGLITAAERPALLERIRDAVGSLEKLTGKTLSPTITGGQAHDEQFCQQKADICGRTFRLTQTLDAELLGTAIIAWIGIGKFSDYETACSQMVHHCKEFIPANS